MTKAKKLNFFTWPCVISGLSYKEGIWLLDEKEGLLNLIFGINNGQ